MRRLTGRRAWFVQRATAVFMLGFLLWLATGLLVWPPEGYEQWRATVAQPAASVGFAAFFAALLAHAWVGIRDIVLDYIHGAGYRVTALVLAAGALIALAVRLGLALAALHIG